MNKEQQEEELLDAFGAFAGEYPHFALSLITGLFVGLLEYSVKEQGGDETLEIKIDGCGKRNITVSAKPHNAEVVGGYFRVEVGEHSNMNDPREMAIAILEGEYQTDSDADRKLAAAQATIAEMREADLKIVGRNLTEEMALAAARLFDEANGRKITAERLWQVLFDAAPPLAIPTNLDALHEAMALECERLKEVAHTMPEQDIPTLWLDLQAAEHRERKSK